MSKFTNKLYKLRPIAFRPLRAFLPDRASIKAHEAEVRKYLEERGVSERTIERIFSFKVLAP